MNSVTFFIGVHDAAANEEHRRQAMPRNGFSDGDGAHVPSRLDLLWGKVVELVGRFHAAVASLALWA